MKFVSAITMHEEKESRKKVVSYIKLTNLHTKTHLIRLHALESALKFIDVEVVWQYCEKSKLLGHWCRLYSLFGSSGENTETGVSHIATECP